MNQLSYTLLTAVCFAVTSIFAVFLAQDCLRKYFYRRNDFAIFAWFLAFCNLLFGSIMFLLWAITKHDAYMIVGFVALASFSIGIIHAMAFDNSNPSSSKRATSAVIFVIPFLSGLTFLVPSSTDIVIGSSLINNVFLILNSFASTGIFLSFLLGFINSRVKLYEAYSSVSFSFIVLGSLMLLFGQGNSAVSGSSFLYLIGIATFSYTWVNYD
ncbi:MAG TPA: hypothetical protein PL190_04110 [Caldisericia bacterium]|nr:MAG: hypothetical protein BWX90_01231 [bacterium ADurb.Bin132]HNW31581.1 hypothetical protein [Caldisericia bacterium]HNY60946.1 hypothetical protein [Caldisericia bacterium]HOC78878.1 hypothetical protein [Caldisericia bacterium]HOG69665.1 hypothetical protein [Caldisericia bacterium]